MKYFFGILILALLLGGCGREVRYHKNFVFENTNSDVDNDNYCLKLCKEREQENFNYRCDYDPVMCEDGKCLCKTW